MAQLRAVNAYGNRTRYLEDIVNYGVKVRRESAKMFDLSRIPRF